MKTALVYATNVSKKVSKDSIVAAGEIRLFNNGSEDILLRERDGPIESLLVHGGRLFDSGNYDKVFETFPNNTVAYRSGKYGSGQLIEHQGKLGHIFHDSTSVKEIGVSPDSPALAHMVSPIEIGHVHSHKGTCMQ